MVCAIRAEGEYAISFETREIASIANAIRTVPDNYINKSANGVTDECIDYILPLIQGEPAVTYRLGLPEHITL